jgi:hydroxymethylglutaryl-CoA reductase
MEMSYLAEKSSRIQGFYKKTIAERVQIVKEWANLSEADVSVLQKTIEPMGGANGNFFIENVIGVMQVPLGVATNFKVNGKDYLVPMALEEASVVAAASNSAKVTLKHGGFHCTNTGPLMIGQIQCVNVADPFATKFKILEVKDEIIQKANEQDPVLIKFGGGCKDMEVRVLDTNRGPMVITHLIVNTGDAMGANAVNTMVEAVAPIIERVSGGRVFLRILSNLADKRIVRARAIFNKEELATDDMTGDQVVDGILEAYAFAAADPYRAATHNKGIMNAISAITLATANDWRAIEAGAHSYAGHTGHYTSLTTYEKDKDGNLIGTIELPLALGLVGGATRIHPVAQIVMKILGVKKATELAEIVASAGLAQNFGAMRALATTGIQAGHMRLHARNMAMDAINQSGADPKLADQIVNRLIKEKGKVTMDRIQTILTELSKK